MRRPWAKNGQGELENDPADEFNVLPLMGQGKRWAYGFDTKRSQPWVARTVKFNLYINMV